MSDVWTVAMMVSGGLFVGGVVSIAWERLPTWDSRPSLPECRHRQAPVGLARRTGGTYLYEAE
jgi:hypothetical protein